MLTNLDIKIAVKTAKELYYSEETIEKLRHAKTDIDITRILAEARKEKYDDKD